MGLGSMKTRVALRRIDANLWLYLSLYSLHIPNLDSGPFPGAVPPIQCEKEEMERCKTPAASRREHRHATRRQEAKKPSGSLEQRGSTFVW